MSLSEAGQPHKSDIDNSIGDFVSYVVEHRQRPRSPSRHHSQSVPAASSENWPDDWFDDSLRIGYLKSFYDETEPYRQHPSFLLWLKSRDTSPLSTISSFRQGSSDEPLETKGKAVMYPTDTLDQRRPKNLKPDTLHPSVEPGSHISGSTENIMKDQPTSSYHPSPNPEDKIPQLTQGTLNLIIQAVNTIVAKALDQKLGPDHRRPAIVFDDPASNDTRYIAQRDWRPEEIGFFDPDCKEPGPVVTINHHIYYRDVYAFIDRLKDVALLRSMEKPRVVLPQLLRGSALIWYSTELFANEREMLRLVPLEYWYTQLITRFKKRTSDALYALQVEKYTIANAREGKSPRIYAQSLFRHAKTAQITSVYNRLMIAWNNLDWQFRVHIPEPKEDTTMQDFLNALDSKSIYLERDGKTRY